MGKIKIQHGNKELIATREIKLLIKEVNQYVINMSNREAWIDDLLLDILEEQQWRFHEDYTETELEAIFSDLFWNEAIDYVKYLKEN